MLFLRPFCKAMAKKDIPAEILEAAKELFFKHGFKRISIEDICNKADVSRRTFYVYYENKTTSKAETDGPIAKCCRELR